MKVALQISGHFRKIEESFSSLKKNIFDANAGIEIDIYIHSWSNNNTDEGLELYKPKEYIIENEKPELIPRMSMFYSMWKVNELRRKNNEEYDFVIRYRTDCLIEEPILFNKPEGSKLYIPKNKIIDTADGPVEDESYCDWLLWGTPDTMNIVSDTYLFWDKYIDDNGFVDEIIPMSESMLYIQVNRHVGLFTIERPELLFKLIR